MQKLNKELYLKKRKEQTEISQEKRRDLCLQCFRPKANCFCQFIKPFDPGIKIVFLMHPMELKRERVGTGRLAHLSLVNSEMIMGVNFTQDKRVNELIADKKYYPVLLYPGDQAMNLSKGEFSNFHFQGKTLLLFLIDGTWPCAKKMMKESINLHSLPRLSFETTRRSEFLVKQQPGDFCLSTIEALHEFFCIWEKQKLSFFEGKHDQLMSVFREVVKFQIACAEDPNKKSYRKKKGFTAVKERKIAKKWESRKIFF